MKKQTPAQRHKATQEALGRSPRQMWATKEEWTFCRSALFAYRECGNGLNAMEKLLIEMRSKEGEAS